MAPNSSTAILRLQATLPWQQAWQARRSKADI
jgi:hypothetical protein